MCFAVDSAPLPSLRTGELWPDGAGYQRLPTENTDYRLYKELLY